MTAEPVAAPGTGRDTPARWVAFASVTAAFMAVTIAESLLAPALPVVARDLDLALDGAGVALGTLTGAIAVGNFVGGYLLARAGNRVAIILGLTVTAAGCFVVAVPSGTALFLAGQVAIGLGAGVYFPAGLQAADHHAGARRRGLAMGLFGVAFSGGLTTAAMLAAFGATVDWRVAFVIAGVLCATAVVVIVPTPLPARPPRRSAAERRPLRDALGVPVFVASIAAICQYGTVGFLPTYAVLAWDLTAARAALLLAVARVASVPAKVLAGVASDRFGTHTTLGGLGVVLVSSGLVWTLLSASWPTYAAAVVFGATVSAVFPISNVLALERFGGRGPLIGLFRSAQIGAGALGAWLVGVMAASIGLSVTLTVTVGLPLGLIVLGRATARRAPSIEREPAT